MDVDRNFLDYEQFCTRHGFNPHITEFWKLRNALPREFVFLTRNIMTHQIIQPELAPLSIQGIPLLDKKYDNSFIRKCFTKSLVPGQQNRNNILHKFVTVQSSSHQ